MQSLSQKEPRREKTASPPCTAARYSVIHARPIRCSLRTCFRITSHHPTCVRRCTLLGLIPHSCCARSSCSVESLDFTIVVSSCLQDPEYEPRIEMLPEYRRSIEERYPPVCSDCAPAVEEEIRKRDDMARTRALGGFLQESTNPRRQVAPAWRDKDLLEREIAVWKVQGCLWFTCLLCAFAGHAIVASGYGVVGLPDPLRSLIPAVVLSSTLWTAWDPMYASLRRAQFQGRMIRLRGKTEYNILQITAWLSRSLTSLSLAMSGIRPAWDVLHLWDNPRSLRARIYCSASLVLELLVLICSYIVLQLQRPPPVRLTTNTSVGKRPLTSPTPMSRSTTPAAAEPDLFASLTLSSKPVVVPPAPPPASNHIFGMPSLPVARSPSSLPPPRPRMATVPLPSSDMDIEDDDASLVQDPDAMDWSPIRPSSPNKPYTGWVNVSAQDDGTWLRPQRFFAPEEPTGLENLFAKTIRLADDDQVNRERKGTSEDRSKRQQARLRTLARIWPLVAALLLIPLIGIAYRVLQHSRWNGVYTRMQ
ncbi:hypothetical protein AcW1_000708 [Taiwanofungus camphoratus]|nr:hypothetical protein AcW2_000790 [Antrodia cinnamomea]KAI0936480.1 hypothetical protein AcV5_004608 [Antrodia cinnamomea]KAI0961693.1 hypothetical protein AcV7_000728 [Antrodia cinnamomea]KAI0963705.1 hypothetical protein AcW1_000708 [Antrodia cinnamomea]